MVTETGCEKEVKREGDRDRMTRRGCQGEFDTDRVTGSQECDKNRVTGRRWGERAATWKQKEGDT